MIINILNRIHSDEFTIIKTTVFIQGYYDIIVKQNTKYFWWKTTKYKKIRHLATLHLGIYYKNAYVLVV